MRAILFAALLALPIGSSAQKDLPLPSELPPFGPDQPLSAPSVRAEKLPNGMTVWLVERAAFPQASISFAVSGGSAADPKDRPGLSQLLASTLDQGTRVRSAEQIARELQQAGGDLSSSAQRDIIRVSTTALATNVQDALTTLADVLENAAFPDAEVALAKRNLVQTLRSQEADPSFLASRAMNKVLFRGSPYALATPTEESIKAITPQELRDTFSTLFRPDSAVLVVVGDFKADEILRLINERFGAWHNPSKPAYVPAVFRTQDPSHAIYLVPRPNSVQTTLLFGSLAPLRGDADYAAAEVANTIYGGTFGSRLTTNIREEKGYTYSAYSFLQIFRHGGALCTRADVRNAVTAASINEVFYEQNRMATTPPTEMELRQAERFLVGLKALQMQSERAVAFELTDLWGKGLASAEIGSNIQRIANVSISDIEGVARKYFSASRMALVAVGDEQVIRDSLDPFGLPISVAP